MNGTTNYMDSITVGKLKIAHGRNLNRLLIPWSFSTLGSSARRTDPVHVIGGGVVTSVSKQWIIWNNRPPSKLVAASTSTKDTPEGDSAGYVYIEGVDEYYKKVSESLALNGTGNSDETYFKYRSVNKAIIGQFGKLHEGSDVPNLGVIDIGSGTNASGSLSLPYATINAAMSSAYPRQYAVHSEETVYITGVTATATNNASGLWSMWVSVSEPFEGESAGNVNLVGGYRSILQNDEKTLPVRVCSVAFNGNESSITFTEPYEVKPRSIIYFTLDETDKLTKTSIFAQGFKIDHKITSDFHKSKRMRREDNAHRMGRLTKPRLNKPEFYLQRKNLNRK